MFASNPNAGQGQPAAAAAPQATTTICIAALADGTFMVYPEPEGGAEDAAGAQAGGADEESSEMAGGQPAQDVDGALQLAKQMLSAGPAAAGGQGAPADDSADALFQQGFNKASGNPLNRG